MLLSSSLLFSRFEMCLILPEVNLQRSATFSLLLFLHASLFLSQNSWHASLQRQQTFLGVRFRARALRVYQLQALAAPSLSSPELEKSPALSYP
jgi:hypothetical protein